MISSIKIRNEKKMILSIDHFQLDENKINFLFGESGIGKSLISKSIFDVFIEPRLDIDLKTDIKRNELLELRKNGFYIFQEASSSMNQEMRIEEQLSEGDIKDIQLPQELIDTLFPNFSALELKNLLKRFPDSYQPSGGEKQRILLLMFFKKYFRYIENKGQTALFVLDEAVANLDENLRNKVIDLLVFLYREKRSTIIFISHDYSIIEYISRVHPGLIDNSVFKELSKTSDDILEQNDFKIGDYLKWVRNIEVIEPADNRVIVSVEQNFRVFDTDLELILPGAKGSIEFIKGNIYQLKAASGVGKTTFARILNGTLEAERVSIEFKGKAVDERTKQSFWKRSVWGQALSMVYQQADEALNPETTVFETFKRLNKKDLRTKNQVDSFLKNYFENYKQSFLKKKIKHLSGGQKQRINLLRTVAVDSEMIIMDEPLTGLDFRTVQSILKLIVAILSKGKVILLISHNESLFDRLIANENQIYLKRKS